MDTCFLHSMLHFTFALKKDFIEIWISFGLIKYSYVKLLIFSREINRLD